MRRTTVISDQSTLEDKALAVPASRVAQLLGISERHLHNLRCNGLVPDPVKLGHSVRWSVVELRAWLNAGSPNREAWEAMKLAGAALRDLAPLPTDN